MFRPSYRIAAAAAFLVACFSPCQAQIRLPNLLSDHGVLDSNRNTLEKGEACQGKYLVANNIVIGSSGAGIQVFATDNTANRAPLGLASTAARLNCSRPKQNKSYPFTTLDENEVSQFGSWYFWPLCIVSSGELSEGIRVPFEGSQTVEALELEPVP
jgi:hypothetical protein